MQVWVKNPNPQGIKFGSKAQTTRRTQDRAKSPNSPQGFKFDPRPELTQRYIYEDHGPKKPDLTQRPNTGQKPELTRNGLSSV